VKNREVIKKRFLKDPLPLRLGNLASNLSRISFFSRTVTRNRELLNDVLEESKFFIEWVAPKADVELAGWLAQIQIKLSLWQSNWQMKQTRQIKQASVLTERWSFELLKRAGLRK